MARENDPDFQLEAMIDKYSLAKVTEMLAGICGGKASHIEENWQDEKLARVWQSASNTLKKQANVFRNKHL